MELRRKPKGEKICRGAYNYYKRGTLYAEEEFEVYRDRQELSISFFAYLYARIPTGELLTTYVDYVVSKDFMPKNLYIEKMLGKSIIQENYSYDPKENELNYHYSGPKSKENLVITTPSKFTLTTPTTSTSFTFLRTKKEDTVAKNYYTVYGSDNNWNFNGPPDSKIVVMERTGIGFQTIDIDGKKLQATPYKLFDGDDLEDDQESINAPHLNISLSKVLTIPYLIKSEDDTKIQIKYLNDFESA
jgi:hypothetical protein